MNDALCEVVREGIPDVVSGRSSGEGAASVEGHLVTCEECRAEFELARTLFASRPRVPARLAARVVSAVQRDRTTRASPWWGLSAAAVAALALGIGISSDSPAMRDSEVPNYAYEVEEGALWLSDDGLLAGAPSFDALSDEALAELLDELAVGTSPGGSL
ncbi:MAG: hypothetical protein O2956_12040 [Gemmatimonadetes bacterium]|nr:hypothetical protein [Gemmatimonadota bacterium]